MDNIQYVGLDRNGPTYQEYYSLLDLQEVYVFIQELDSFDTEHHQLAVL